MISKEEVIRIAKLARLELTEEEIKKMQKDLTEILDYVSLLKKAPTSRPKGYLASAGKAQSNRNLRKDEFKTSSLASEIISESPDKKDSYIKVKTIL